MRLWTLVILLLEAWQCETREGTPRRAASPVDAFGTPVPDSLAIPNIPQASPPARLTSSAGYLELELVLGFIDLSVDCEVFRNDADQSEPSISCFRGSCVSIVRLPGLKVDAEYTFTMQIVQRIRDPASGLWFEFHGARSRPITFVTAGLPDWQLAIPNTTSLGSIVMRLSWEEPMTGGSSIQGYVVEMETDVNPGWTTIYDGSLDPMVKHLVLENLTYGTTYFYNVYAINAIGRSKPISTAYTVAVPLEKTFFYPLSTDPSIPRDPIPDSIVADMPTELAIRAKNPVTERLEEGSTHRKFLAAIHDACELNVMRSLCLPVAEHHPDYQDHRQRVKRTPDCCHVSTPNGDGTYSLSYTGNQTGIYSLMVYTIFPNGLWGQYWDNNWFYGLPVLSRVDAEINFQWGQQEVTALAGDHITARWVGFLQGPSTNEYTIYVKADDSVKVWFQGELVVDYWDSPEPCCPEHWTRQQLVQGEFYSIRVDWKEVQGNAQLRLMWGITGKRKQVIPSEYLWRGAPLINTPYRIVVVPGEPSSLTSGLVEPLERVRSSVKQIIYFQALDIRGNTVNSTNVTFEAFFYLSNDTMPMIFRSIPLMLKRRSADEWLHDHLHYMEFVLTEPGNYTLELYLQGVGQLANSPMEILATQDDVQPQMCTISGPGALGFTAGVETSFTLQLRDAFQNPVPHIDGTEISVDIAFREEISPNTTVNDQLLRNLTGGHYTTATSITKGPHGTFLVSYTGLRAGLNILTVKVNGLLIMGEEEQVKYFPPLLGQNRPLEIIGTYNHLADGQMTIFAPARLPAECTTGVICSAVLHVRDTYGNPMLKDFRDQLRFHTASTSCNPRDPYDEECVPVDEGGCYHLFGEMHACELVPTISGNFVLRVLVNGQDASFGAWRENANIYTLEGSSYTQGPTPMLINIGDINASTSTMEGPGLDLAGNVVGVSSSVTVQLKDRYGNNRIVTGSDFDQRRLFIVASLGDTPLTTEVHSDGTISVTVQTLVAGYHRLRVRMGLTCQADPNDQCYDISGSPSDLLWWEAAEVSENGMTCEMPYIYQAGRQYHFTCTGRDLWGNVNRDHELQLTAHTNYDADPDGNIPPDGWFRGNSSENFNSSFKGSYSAADSLYHFDVTLYRAGYYAIWIHMGRGNSTVLVLPNNVGAVGRPLGERTIILCSPAEPSAMSSVVVPFVTASATVANEVQIQTRDRFGNAIEISNGEIVTGLLYGQQQVSISFIHLVQGRYRGVLVPPFTGETLVGFYVAGESILGSPFDFVVTPGPMVITRSLVEGFPNELTAGKLSCWNITLRDGNDNHLLSGQFNGDPTQLEDVTCSDDASFCNHTELNGTFTCCINKTMVLEGEANFFADSFQFSCRVRGGDIGTPVDLPLKPHALSPMWPDSTVKTGYGMMGPYDFPTFINEQLGWQDWPSVFDGTIPDDLTQQPPIRYTQVRLWYTDGFHNVFKGDDAVVLLCEVKGPHTLSQRTLGRPPLPIYRLPYVLNQEIGVFEVDLDFKEVGYHEVYCSVAVRGGLNAQYFTNSQWLGTETRQVDQEVNANYMSTSARWDTLLVPPQDANYTLSLWCHGKDAVLILEQLRATVRTDSDLDEDLETSIGPLFLKAHEPYSLQMACSSVRGASAQLSWESDGGIATEVVPSAHLFHSKTLLLGYPKSITVAKVVEIPREEPVIPIQVITPSPPVLTVPTQVPLNLRRKPDTAAETADLNQTDHRITVMWDPPVDAASSSVTHYQVSLTHIAVLETGLKERNTSVLNDTRSEAEREMRFDDLWAGQIYAIAVRSVNGAGHGPWTELVMPASGYSTAPREIRVADQSSNSIVIAWDEPLNVGAGGLQGYSIYANVSTTSSQPSPYLIGTTAAGQNRMNFTGWSYVATDGRLRNVELIPGRFYELFVEASSPAGVGWASRSAAVSAVAAGRPSAPRDFTVDLQALTGGEVALSWTVPESDASSPITAYRVQRRKTWPGTFLTQCSVLINNLGDPGGECVIANFSEHGDGDHELAKVNNSAVRIYTGRVAVRNVPRDQNYINCSTDVFGDPLFPTAVWNPNLGFEALRECYVLTQTCEDESGWFDTDGDCAWYAAEVNRCQDFGASPGLWDRMASEACCACGGKRETELSFCAKEGGSCEFNSTMASFEGTQADDVAITPVYFGKLESSLWNTTQTAVVACSRAPGATEVTGVLSFAYTTQQFCYVVETDLGGWMELSSATTFSTQQSYSDVRVAFSQEYHYRAYAQNAAISGMVSTTQEISLVVGGLPDPPETLILGSDQMTVRISWIEPSTQGLEIEGYRVYVDGELAYDGATDSVTREFTLLGCTRGELRDLAVAAVNAGGETLVPTVITRYCARRPYKPEPPSIVTVDCQEDYTARPKIENYIRIAYNEPEDNGGRPLTGWRIQRAAGQSLSFRGVGPLFPIPENEVYFDDYNDLDGAGKIGLDYGEIYKYRVVAVNGIDEWDDESASDYTIVRCGEEPPTPWWLLLNESSTSTSTMMVSNASSTEQLVTGFVWSTEMETTTTTMAPLFSKSDAFYKLTGLDPMDIYLVEEAEEGNVSESITEFYEGFEVATPPILRRAWTACNASSRGPSPCAEFFPNQPDITGCVRLEFEPNESSLECPIEAYQIYRNNELIATVAPGQNGIVDGFTDNTYSAANLLFPGTRFSCYVTVPNTNLHDKQIYKIRTQNCKGWGPFSADVLIPVISPPAAVCGQYGFDSHWQYTCLLDGLNVTPLNETSARFDWTLLQEVPFVDIASNFSRIQAEIGQVGPGEFLTLAQQLIGSYDPRVLLGYELFLDDGLGGPFELAFNGKRWSNTATISKLSPGRVYRAFVRAVSIAGNGDSSNVLSFKMAMPLPPPTILSVTSVALKSATLRWEIGEATVDTLAISHYIVQMAMEPTFDAWFDVANSPADNTEYGLLVTQLEPDFKYAVRIQSASANGVGAPSEPYYFWGGLLPTEGARLVQRVESPEGIIRIQWQFPSGDMLGTGTRMEGVTSDWGVKGYMWDPKEQPSLVYDGFGNPTQVEFTVANATCGGNYLVALSLVTMIGEGPMSTPLAVTNARLPGPPRNVVVTNTTTSSISLAWEEPEDTGCVPIHQYRILRYFGDQGFQIVGYAAAASGVLQIPAAREYVDDGRCFIEPPAVDDGSCNCPPSCFSAGNLYRFQIQACVLGAYGLSTLELAEGPLGCGPNSGTVSAFAAENPGPVRDVRLGEPEGNEVQLSWTAPATDGMNGSSFTYAVEMDQGGVFVSLGNTTETTFRVTGLQLQFAYVFRISSSNRAGYVTRSNIFSYTATSLPDGPDPPSPIGRAEWVSSAFYEHPSIASTPVPEGVTLRFSPTAVDGYAWAAVMTDGNASVTTVESIKAGAHAVGGALCSRQQQVVTRGQIYLWRLGSENDPTDPTGCYLSHGGRYAIVVYVQSIASFNAGLEDGTLSGAVYFTVITGLSNTFMSSPTLNSPLTESGVTLAFTPRRNGWGWAMILPEAAARTANKETVYDLVGALGGPFCKHGPRQLFADREEAWVFSGCLLTVGSSYTVLAYIAGIGAHLDGVVETASAVAISASNSFSTYPTISGAPSGDGITVQLRARSAGYLWLMITVGPVALTIDLIKAGEGAVGSSSCRLLQQLVDTALQSYDLTGCKLNSGPEYALHAYIEGSDTAQNDGSFAGTVTFQVTPSNIFVVYPSFISEITGLGFVFQMTSSFAGRFWCMVIEGDVVQTVQAVKLGTAAVGTVECWRTAELLTGGLQEILMTNCQLSQDRLYSLFVYIEDFNGNDDGILAGPLIFFVSDSNDFEDSPVALAAEPEGFGLSLVAAREGYAWGAAFTDYAEAAKYYENVPSFLDRFYPLHNESCAPMGVPVLAENITNISFGSCGFNYSTNYWALIYIEGLQKTRSGAMSYPVEVKVPASNTFLLEPRGLATRPFYADFEMSTVKGGYLWMIIVHKNHTEEVDEVAVKTGILPTGTVNCKLLDVEVNESVQSYRVESCQLVATYEYYAFFYAEGPYRAEDADGVLSGPLLVWFNASNSFIQEPRIQSTMTTNVFYFNFIPEKDGNFWAVVADSTDIGLLNIWNIKTMLYGQPAADCKRERRYILGGFFNTEEFLFCYFERGPKTYRLFVYLEDTNEADDGIMYSVGIIVPGSAEVTNQFSIRPYLVEPETIRGVKFTFRPSSTGYAWAGLITEASWRYRTPVNNSNGNHADTYSIEIYDIMFFVDMVGSEQLCYKQAIAVTAGQDYTWELQCSLEPGARYRLFAYVIGPDYWDEAADPDALTRSPFWNPWHRDNGRVSNGVEVLPPFSNDWAWPDGHPYISQGPHGMGMDVTFGTSRPQGLVWAVVQDATDTNLTILAVKNADKAWGPAPCRQMGAPAIYPATYTLTLSSCSLLPTPKLYVLILYTEDQAVQNDGKLSDPIYFQVPVSNGFVIQPSVVGESGRDDGVSISFEARTSGKVWIYIATKASADATEVTIPNVKDAVNVFDRTNCLVDGLSVNAALEVISMPNCPLVYLESYVVYIYIEDHKSHFDGTLSTPLNLTVGASNSFTVEPALLSVPTTDRIDFSFTPKKRGRAWVVVTPSASLVEPPSRSRMVANVGAVGSLSCRVSASSIDAMPQSYSLTGCQLDPGQIYALYVYIEDHRFNTDGTLSRTVFVKVIRSNNFDVSPVLVTLPTLDGFDVRFQASVSGRAWAMAVDAIGGSGVTSLSIRNLEGALGGTDCQFRDVPIDDSLQLWNFSDCNFQDSFTYMIFIYVEAWPSVEGDGMLSGPMIASFFDASNVSAENSGDLSPVLIVENVPIVSNWFRQDPQQTGPASPNGATLTLRAATDGMLFVLLTRYRPQVSGETVYNGWNAVGGPGCQKMGTAITDQVTTVQLSECGLLRGRYYYAFAYVVGPEGGLNGTLSPAVEIFVPTASNDFSVEPRVLATPRISGVHFTFAATQEFGTAWVMMVEAWKAHEITVEALKSFTNAVGGSNCRRSSVAIGTAAQDVLLAESTPNAGDGCGLVSDGFYVVAVYVEDANGLNDGTLALLQVHVSPEKSLSNIFGAGPMMVENPTSSDVRLKFVAVQTGRYWAFILPSDRINVFTVETAKFMDLNPDTVGQASCRKNDVSMGIGETVVELTNCDLVLSGAGITFYSAFVYVEDDTGEAGQLSPPVAVLDISNTFLWPFPRIAAFSTNGSLSVEVFPRNSGRIWARIVLASLYSTVERYAGDLSLQVLKNWQNYPDNGPSYLNGNCSFDALDFTVELNVFGTQAATWLNFTNCTFDPRIEYMIGIYVEDSGDNNDGEISAVRVLKNADASNYFLISPRLVGIAYAENFTMEFRTANVGIAWCSIVLPEMLEMQNGADVIGGKMSLGGESCCGSVATTGFLQQWALSNCSLQMDTTYIFLMYTSTGGLDGTLTSGYPFRTFGTLGHIRVTWLQKETDVGGPVDRYRIFLNGTQVYDDFSLRSSLEQSRAGSPPRWVRMVDVACTPGNNYQVTLAGRNFAGWSVVSDPLFSGCFLRPGQISKLREVQSWSLGEDRAALALAWDTPPASAGRTEYYNVYRDRGLRQANFELIGTTTSELFNDTNVVFGLAYGYQVTAVNAFGEGAVSDVLFVQPDAPVDIVQTVVPGILSQANVQLVPAATFGVVDEVGGVVQIYTDVSRELRVEGYSSQRLAHIAAFGPVELILEAVDLAGNTGEEDPCSEARLAIDVGDLHNEFCAGDAAEASVFHKLSYGSFAIISWQTGSLSTTTSSHGWSISLKPS